MFFKGLPWCFTPIFHVMIWSAPTENDHFNTLGMVGDRCRLSVLSVVPLIGSIKRFEYNGIHNC